MGFHDIYYFLASLRISDSEVFLFTVSACLSICFLYKRNRIHEKLIDIDG